MTLARSPGVTANGTGDANLLVIDLETTAGELRDTISDNRISNDTDYFRGYNLLNYDIRSLDASVALQYFWYRTTPQSSMVPTH